MKKNRILIVVAGFIIAFAMLQPATRVMAGNAFAKQSLPDFILPTVTQPTVSMISDNSALLGADVINDGGSPITARGTVWSTSPGVQLTDNPLAEGDLSTGIFSHFRDLLPAKTRIYFKAYASNNLGTATSDETSFFTLASEPLTYPTIFNAVAFGNSAISLNWSAVSGADGYLIIVKSGLVGPVSVPADASAYNQGDVIADGTVAAIISNGGITNCTINGLLSTTQYTFLIFPYTSDGVNSETWNYKTDGVIPLASASTTNAVYTWIGPDNGNWADASNWSPARSVPSGSDVILFNDGTSKTINNVPNQTIAQCFVSNSSSITFKSASNAVLSISGGAMDDLIVENGSSLTLSGSSPVKVALSVHATATISGIVRLTGGSHGLVANSGNSILFTNGSSCIAGTAFSGTAFGNVTANSVIFQSGSTYVQQSNQANSPFGLSQPNSVVVFMPGSRYRHESTSNPAFSGRTYADFELNIPSVFSPTGVYPCTIDNMIISSGTLNFNLSGGLTIHNNISVTSGCSLNFLPVSSASVTLNSSLPQYISGSGTITTGTFSNFIISNSSGVILNTDARINGVLTLSAGFLTMGTGNLIIGPLAAFAGNPSAANMIIATAGTELRKEFAENYTGTFVFPVGDNTGVPEYSPVSISVNSGFFQPNNYIGVNLSNTKHPADPNINSYLNRYWKLSQYNVEDLSCSLTFNYTEADIAGIENMIYCLKIDPLPITLYNPAVAGIHELTATNVTGLGTFTGSQVLPTVFNVTGSGSYCMGAEGITVTLGNSEPGVMYRILKNGIVDGAPAFGTGLPVTWHNIHFGTYTVEAINLAGTMLMQGTAVIEEIVPQPVNVIVIPDEFSICQGNSTTFHAIPYNGGTPAYQWYVNSIATGNGSANFTFSPSDGDRIQVFMTSSLNCVSGNIAGSNVVEMNVSSMEVIPEVNGPVSVCSGVQGILYSALAGKTNYIWNVSPGGVITAGGTNEDPTILVAWNQSGNQWVSLSYTSEGGCASQSATVLNVTVNAVPVPQINGPAESCLGNPDNIFYTTPGMSNYIWTVSAGGTITSGGSQLNNSAQATWNTVGRHVVSVNYTDISGCSGQYSTYHTIEINPLPQPTVSGPSQSCVFSEGNVYQTQSNMTDYSWVISQGGIITSGGGPQDASITVKWITSGPKTLSVNYTNSDLCRANEPTVFNVNINVLPLPIIVGTAEVCAGTQNVFYTTESGMSAYQWNVSEGGAITSGGGLNDNSITVSWNSPGQQLISVSFMDNSGCVPENPAISNIIVHELPIPAINGASSACLNSTGNIYVSDANMSDYNWTVTQGGELLNTGGSTGNVAIINWNDTENQSITLNYTDHNGCTAVSPTLLNVMVHPLPIPAISGLVYLCEGSSNISYSTDDGMNSYHWTITGGGQFNSGSSGNQIFATWNETGPQNITVNYTDLNGCSSQNATNHEVFVNPIPGSEAGANASIFQGEMKQLWGSGSGGNPPYQYNWTPAESLSGSFINDPVAFPLVNTTYKLIVTDNAGCSSTDSVRIEVLPPPADITGVVSYLNPLASPLNNVLVTLLNSGNNILATSVTNQNGEYSFTDLIPGEYKLRVTCTKAWGGVNSNDALIILKHFTMTDTLSGLKLLAGDVNADKAVNSIDAFLSSKRFVYLITSFVSGDWVFESKTINMNSVNVVCNIKALCYGDVSGSYKPPSVKTSPTIQLKSQGVMKVSSFQSFEYPVSVLSAVKLGALSLIFNYNEKLLTFEEGLMNHSSDIICNAVDGELRISWYNINPLDFNDEQLLSLRFTANDISGVSDEDLEIRLNEESEIANQDGSVLNELFLAAPKIVQKEDEMLFFGFPNPATKNLVLSYSLQQLSEISIVIVNVSGDEVLKPLNNATFQKGTHSIPVDVSNLSPGIYFARIIASGQNATRTKDWKITIVE